jgi:MoaA/NifB/PqqE/SkfB family radical SAM enzyme
MLHSHMVEMIEFAKSCGARIWLNTNGSMFGPTETLRDKLRRVLKAGIDLIEFSMDAGDAETYAIVRPPRGGPPRDPDTWWNNGVENVRAALALRKEYKVPSRVVVSIIRQKEIDGKLEAAVDFWLKDVGVDEVITRKFLTWDDNTVIQPGRSMDPHLYRDLPSEKKQPCVWPFERLNIDTLGRIALCGQDISFRTSELFLNVNDVSIKEIWQGQRFNWYRQLHLDGRGAEAWPCRGCSAWLAGIRDWHHGWLKVLKTSGDHLKEVMVRDLGVEVEMFEPNPGEL